MLCPRFAHTAPCVGASNNPTEPSSIQQPDGIGAQPTVDHRKKTENFHVFIPGSSYRPRLLPVADAVGYDK